MLAGNESPDERRCSICTILNIFDRKPVEVLGSAEESQPNEKKVRRTRADIAFEEWRLQEEQADEERQKLLRERAAEKWNYQISRKIDKESSKMVKEEESDERSLSGSVGPNNNLNSGTSVASAKTENTNFGKSVLGDYHGIHLKIDPPTLKMASRIERILGIEGIEVGVYLPSRGLLMGSKRKKGILRSDRNDGNKLECEVLASGKRKCLRFQLSEVTQLMPGKESNGLFEKVVDTDFFFTITFQEMPTLVLEFENVASRDATIIAVAVMISQRLGKPISSIIGGDVEFEEATESKEEEVVTEDIIYVGWLEYVVPPWEWRLLVVTTTRISLFAAPEGSKIIDQPDDLKMDRKVRKLLEDLKSPYDIVLIEDNMEGYSHDKDIEFDGVDVIVAEQIGTKFIIKLQSGDDEEGDLETHIFSTNLFEKREFAMSQIDKAFRNRRRARAGAGSA